MSSPHTTQYDTAYFSWQSSIGEFGGWANQTKFAKHISTENTVLDFGCGGGYLLHQLNCGKKIGVETNPIAKETAKGFGLEVVVSTKEVTESSVDVVISNHALEHVHHPLQELEDLHRVLKPGGKIILVVPCETNRIRYAPDDINHHLYSWSPMALGNLLTEAGFTLQESKPYIHKWPPGYRWIAKLGGRILFDLSCRLWGLLAFTSSQVRAIGIKIL